MNLRTILMRSIAFAVVAGCSDPEAPRSSLITPLATPSKLDVSVEIIGEQPGLPVNFKIKLDDQNLTLASNTSVSIAVAAGSHTVALQPVVLSPSTLQCDFVGQATQSVFLDAGQAATVKFTFRCAQIVASTGLDLSVTTSGLYTPKYVTVTITEPVIVPQYIVDQMTPGGGRFFALAPGVYIVAISAQSCGSFTTPSSATRTVTVTSGRHLALGLSLYCLP